VRQQTKKRERQLAERGVAAMLQMIAIFGTGRGFVNELQRCREQLLAAGGVLQASEHESLRRWQAAQVDIGNEPCLIVDKKLERILFVRRVSGTPLAKAEKAIVDFGAGAGAALVARMQKCREQILAAGGWLQHTEYQSLRRWQVQTTKAAKLSHRRSGRANTKKTERNGER